VWRRPRVSITSVNRELATLRRLLHVAHKRNLIRFVPKVRLLTGERQRDFVLDHETERISQGSFGASAIGCHRSARYHLAPRRIPIAPLGGRPPWSQLEAPAMAGLRKGEGQSLNARRTVSLAARVGLMLATKQHLNGYSLAIPMSVRCSTHRWLKAGADAFTIRKLAGHSSITISQRYVHPTPAAVERPFDRLEAVNQTSLNGPVVVTSRHKKGHIDSRMP
jgi:hypothetical protein